MAMDELSRATGDEDMQVYKQLSSRNTVNTKTVFYHDRSSSSDMFVKLAIWVSRTEATLMLTVHNLKRMLKPLWN